MAKNKKSNTVAINTFKNKAFITKTPQETRNLARNFASVLKGGDIVFLNGNLGSGKTTFTQGITKFFGNRGFARSSSFMLVNEYPAFNNLKLFHLDLYRLKNSTIFDIGIEDYLYSGNISLIEWPQRLIDGQNESHWNIEIESLVNKRKIKIEKKK
ncbi:MAG: tRNA (adenosine(37)-N6)-threonylcarbamoyltransferase complex ATPase subunit type 1 TsaE [Endomicrobium sp.]|jgi:tRNA threonylcarbamoyladenosine biosynthesis protein TsaE|uniref:tRNA (adenosine(37)-N6)-threonylcarbamoyltransferase complex ATPase subunit type 1 TsaE n=1 Tax=Candidatus Endomicrobiellum cubanum TaxID=3242325 RepID=UPI0028378669|nr:tRNA (adenosine(37)-N6)-threonylcarbamoyltransferase complex ATPase subunit type 1 TsaE [Endomicrobium sp.]